MTSARRAGVVAALLLAALILALQVASGAYHCEIGEDESSHYVSGLLLHDYVASGFARSPLAYLRIFHAHYPLVGIGHWPPFYYLVEAAWMLLFSPSRASVLLLSAAVTLATALVLYAILARRHGPLAAVVAAAIFVAAPIVQAGSQTVMLDVPTALACLLAFSAVTRNQIGYWHDDFGLWAHALAVTRNNYVAENNVANALVRQGRIDEAIIHFRTASILEPLDPTSQLNLGIYAEQHGDLGQAKARYEATLRLATDTQLRATAYANLGTVYFALHDYDRAQQNFDAALKLKGAFPVAFLDMGLIAEKTAQTAADWSRAASYFAHFADLEPTDVGYLLLADALHHAGRAQDADLAYRQALQLSSDISQSRQRAAQLLAQ